MNQIKSVLAGIYDNPELRRTIIPLFIGDPGISKTSQVEEFAEERGVQLVTLITSQLSPMEVSGLIMPEKETKTITYFDSESLLSLKDGSILFLDEVLNGSPVVLSAMLTLLTSRVMISGKKLPDIMIVAAANPQNQTPLTPAIKERFVWYNVKFDETMWINYMIKKYGITYTIGEKLSQLIRKEDFLGNNFSSPRSLDNGTAMIIKGVPTPYESKIKFILEEIITNEFDHDLELGENGILKSGEMMPWLTMIRHKLNITV